MNVYIYSIIDRDAVSVLLTPLRNSMCYGLSICLSLSLCLCLSVSLSLSLSLSLSVSLSILTAIFPSGPGLAQYQNVSILDFIAAKDDGGGGDNCSYEVQRFSLIVTTNKLTQNFFYRADALRVAQQTVSEHC